MAIVATVVLLIIRPWSARRMCLGATAVALAASVTTCGGEPRRRCASALAAVRQRTACQEPGVPGDQRSGAWQWSVTRRAGLPLLTSHQTLGNLSRHMRAERGHASPT